MADRDTALVQDIRAENLLSGIYSFIQSQQKTAQSYEKANSESLNDINDNIASSLNEASLDRRSRDKNSRAVDKALKDIIKDNKNYYRDDKKDRATQAALLGKVSKDISGIDKLKTALKDTTNSLKSILLPYFKDSMKSYDNLAKIMRAANLSPSEKAAIQRAASGAVSDVKNTFGLNIAPEEINSAFNQLITSEKNINEMSKEQISSFLALTKRGYDAEASYSMAMSSNLSQIQNVIKNSSSILSSSATKAFNSLSETDKLNAGGSADTAIELQKITRTIKENAGAALSPAATEQLALAQFKLNHGLLKSMTEQEKNLIATFKMERGGDLSQISNIIKNTTSGNLMALEDLIGKEVSSSIATGKAMLQNGKDIKQVIRSESADREADSIYTRNGLLSQKMDELLRSMDLKIFGGSLGDLSTSIDELFGDSADTTQIVSNGFKYAIKILSTIALNTSDSILAKVIKGGATIAGVAAIAELLANETEFGKMFEPLINSIGSIVKNLIINLPKILISAFHELPTILSSITQSAASVIGSISSNLFKPNNKSATKMSSSIGAIASPKIDLESIMTTIGSGINKVAKFIGKVIEPVSSVVSHLIDMIGKVIEPVSSVVNHLIDSIVSIAKLLKPVIDSIAYLTTAIANNIGSVIKVLQTLADAVPSIINFGSTLVSSIKEVALAGLPILQKIAEVMAPVLQEFIKNGLPIISDIVKLAIPIIGDIIKLAIPEIKNIIGISIEGLTVFTNVILTKILPPLERIVNKVIAFFDNAINRIFNSIDNFVNKVESIVSKVEDIVDRVMLSFDNLIGSVKEVLDNGLSIIQTAVNTIQTVLTDISGSIKQVATDIGSTFKEVSIAITNTLCPILTKLADIVLPPLNNILSKLEPTITRLADTILSTIADVLDAMKPSIILLSKILNEVIGFMGNLVASVIDAISNIPGFDDLTKTSAGIRQSLISSGFSLTESNMDLFREEEERRIKNGEAATKIPETKAANGIIVDKPTSTLIGEDGKEVVFPLTKPNKLRSILSKLSNKDKRLIDDSLKSDISYSSAVDRLNKWQGGRLKPNDFFSMFGPIAREDMRLTGIPASVTLAQAALESGWGKSAKSDFRNLFGIKGTGDAGSKTISTHEVYNGTRVQKNDAFAQYSSYLESIKAHSRYLLEAKRSKGLSGLRYGEALAHVFEPNLFAYLLRECGYATSTAYGKKLVNLMESHNLYKWNLSPELVNPTGIGDTQLKLISIAKSNLNSNQSVARMNQLLQDEFNREQDRAIKEGKPLPLAPASFSTGADLISKSLPDNSTELSRDKYTIGLTADNINYLDNFLESKLSSDISNNTTMQEQTNLAESALSSVGMSKEQINKLKSEVAAYRLLKGEPSSENENIRDGIYSLVKIAREVLNNMKKPPISVSKPIQSRFG